MPRMVCKGRSYASIKTTPPGTSGTARQRIPRTPQRAPQPPRRCDHSHRVRQAVAAKPAPAAAPHAAHPAVKRRGRTVIEVRITKSLSRGRYEYLILRDRAPAYRGKSIEPLLDACREIQRMGGGPAQQIRLFWPGRSDPALITTVGTGAALTVDERGPRFSRYRPFQAATRSKLTALAA
jgi:hypothetical protein